mmetsp:Transcript_7941/g.16651  ORF Transcript_7941/g.16651 Transcript_7941/m.16651 type:complete len:200 (+) Transcript_7941:1515-2114(+)
MITLWRVVVVVHSQRSDGPFLPIRCLTMDRSLVCRRWWRIAMMTTAVAVAVDDDETERMVTLWPRIRRADNDEAPTTITITTKRSAARKRYPSKDPAPPWRPPVTVVPMVTCPPWPPHVRLPRLLWAILRLPLLRLRPTVTLSATSWAKKIWIAMADPFLVKPRARPIPRGSNATSAGNGDDCGVSWTKKSCRPSGIAA